ncbi:MAG TPA: prolyl oligopeptidase family serine peptidase [Anaerolineaceae bacterium]
MTPFTYPDFPRQNVVDQIQGVPVPDPYRWLEDDHSPQTEAWVTAQNELTFKYLARIPARPRIFDRMTELWNYEKYSIPFGWGGRYFFTRNDGLQNQAVLYWLDRLDSEPRLLLDPNILSADGTIALTSVAISKDGRRVAYGLSGAGSDWVEMHVRQVDTGEDLPDLVQWVKFSGASWAADGKGFFYSRYDAPVEGSDFKSQNYYHKLYFHKLGEPQSTDRLVYQRPDHKEWLFNGEVSDDGRYLVITVSQGTQVEHAIFYQDLSIPESPVIELLSAIDAEYLFLGNDGTRFYFRTDLDAPLGRVITIDLSHPARPAWQELIPQSLDALDFANLTGDQFFVGYLHAAHSLVKVFSLAGELLRQVELPGIGSAGGFSGSRQVQDAFYLYTSFTDPGTIYHYNLETGQSTVFRQPAVGFSPQDYVTDQVFYPSKDGTAIPMFLVHKKGMPRDGKNPTILYGYGGFNISVTPVFSVPWLVWMEMGGLVAVANLRGGGEYGKAWHEAGMKLCKQNVFDDFIAAAEWLIESRYTRTSRLAIMGRSNGGLLVGACMTQRPDLFGACLPAVGVLDMLRFQKFTIGWAWVSDYGSVDDSAEFRALLAYSPYHNLKPGTAYPATLVTTGDHDDRVFPAHSFKFTAALQAAQAGPAPVLIRVETRAGHGAGKPTTKQIEESADKLAFLVKVLEIVG